VKKPISMLISANAFDYLTTVVGLEKGLVELNPYAHDAASLLVLKVVAILIFVLLFFALKSKDDNIVLRGAYLGMVVGVFISSVLMFAVALQNLALILGT